MLRRVVLGFAAFLIGVVGLYMMNPLGTATLDPRARLLGFTVYLIRSESMTPTYRPGQVLWVSTFAPRFDPLARGDVIAFRYPTDPRTVIVGRLIGMPGETVAIDAGQVSIDGRVLAEPYLGDRPPTRPFSEQMAPIMVPEGHWFILGDHRDNSHDSRFWGALPTDQVVGKVMPLKVD